MKYDPMIEEGKTYVMKGGTVKIANKRYTTIPNDHAITFDRDAEVYECPDQQNDKVGTIYNFTSFGRLKETVGGPRRRVKQMIDVIGVILELQDTGSI